ncbi:hypothetical protein NE237_028025 [Protea cynaroides]|uniref:Uncharacterized protein n=1 Tax=Protea cynaroides TaxID=273540 RepID=A0A9Q0GP39_9MAGN|nr:hypothetical protein NE237_028025 [Protea cynaroides]
MILHGRLPNEAFDPAPPLRSLAEHSLKLGKPKFDFEPDFKSAKLEGKCEGKAIVHASGLKNKNYPKCFFNQGYCPWFPLRAASTSSEGAKKLDFVNPSKDLPTNATGTQDTDSQTLYVGPPNIDLIVLEGSGHLEGLGALFTTDLANLIVQIANRVKALDVEHLDIAQDLRREKEM